MSFESENPYWTQQTDGQMLSQSQHQYYDTDAEYKNMQTQGLDFQPFNEDATAYGRPENYNQYPELFTPMSSDFGANNENVEYDEPPLLEELEIYPDRIVEKTLAVLNPFRSQGLADDAEFLAKENDLAGPMAFCLMLACCLFLSGNKAPFGYIYGLSVVSCLLMYLLLSLMTSAKGVFTLSGVASILGYCLIPIVGLSMLGLFVSLHGSFGISLAIVAVLWSSVSASRLFCAMSGDFEQRPLIAYPCALVCGVFALLVVF